MQDLIGQVQEGFRQQQDRRYENIAREFSQQVSEREARYQLQENQRDKEIAEEKIAEKSRVLDRDNERFLNEKNEAERVLRERETGYKRRIDELTREAEQERRGRNFDASQNARREQILESKITEMTEAHIKEKEKLTSRIDQLNQQLATVNLQKEQTDKMNEDLELMVRERQRERERPEMPQGSPKAKAKISPPEPTAKAKPPTFSITEGGASSSSQPQPKAKAKAKAKGRAQSLQPVPETTPETEPTTRERARTRSPARKTHGLKISEDEIRDAIDGKIKTITRLTEILHSMGFLWEEHRDIPGIDIPRIKSGKNMGKPKNRQSYNATDLRKIIEWYYPQRTKLQQDPLKTT
jgi:hypothetical protein